jgi:hypothetical protein
VSGTKLPDLHSDELLAALSGRAVQFLVVGGIGAQLHGAVRATKDLDICVPWARENFERLAAALDDLDARLDLPPELGIEVPPTSELLRRTSMTRWHTRAGILDVLHDIPAGEAGERRAYRELEEHAVAIRGPNTTVLVAGLDDIIASKEHANRDKDREALPELYALRDQRGLI